MYGFSYPKKRTGDVIAEMIVTVCEEEKLLTISTLSAQQSATLYPISLNYLAKKVKAAGLPIRLEHGMTQNPIIIRIHAWIHAH
jgi:hypothetical protein